MQAAAARPPPLRELVTRETDLPLQNTGRRGEEAPGTEQVSITRPLPRSPLHSGPHTAPDSAAGGMASQPAHSPEPVSGAQPGAHSPVTVELHVPGHLPVRHGIWQLLQLQGLEVHALALVRHDEVRVQWTLGAPSLIPVRREEKRVTSATPRAPSPGNPSHKSATSLASGKLEVSRTSSGKAWRSAARRGKYTGLGLGRPAWNLALSLTCVRQPHGGVWQAARLDSGVQWKHTSACPLHSGYSKTQTKKELSVEKRSVAEA